MLERRRAFAGAQLGSHYYLTRGIREDFQPVTSCEVVDLEHEESKEIPCPKAPRLGGEHDDLLLYTAQHEGQSSEVALLDVAAVARGATTSTHLDVPAPARASVSTARPSALAVRH